MLLLIIFSIEKIFIFLLPFPLSIEVRHELRRVCFSFHALFITNVYGIFHLLLSHLIYTKEEERKFVFIASYHCYRFIFSEKRTKKRRQQNKKSTACLRKRHIRSRHWTHCRLLIMSRHINAINVHSIEEKTHFTHCCQLHC